jgi:RNA polymerase sigma-70 factor (ECF subfamily)
MSESAFDQQLAQIYEQESRPILATLIRLLGDFDRAEEALHEAFRIALEQWPRDGIPKNPRSWLISTGRFKAIDQIRRRARFDQSLAQIAHQIDLDTPDEFEIDEQAIADDQLRLIFTCCHPDLAAEARLALTLREVCGLSTEAIAQAFLLPVPTLAQRIVRAKAKIRDAQIPYQIPERHELDARLQTVLQVIYLVYNEGYRATSGESLLRTDLSAEAIRLGRLLLRLLPDSEIQALLALMLLHESRASARLDAAGDIVPLEEQDRSLWDQTLIREGCDHAWAAWNSGAIGVYTIQAAIAALHCIAPTVEQTDWRQIVGLYDLLLQIQASPIIELNRAVAIAMRDGPQAALPLIDALISKGLLQRYALAYAARADLYRRLDNLSLARHNYELALSLTTQPAERRYLQQRIAALA